MKNTKIIRFAQALILLPIVGVSTPSGVPVSDNTYSTKAPQAVFFQKLNKDPIEGIVFNQTPTNEDQIRKLKAEAINKYFLDRGMPLHGTGMKMVLEAEKNALDWRLLPAIAVRESTGGKFKCQKATFSSFGWGSCKINFDSHEEEIEVVALNLGGNNPNTARHYAGKTIKGILQAYNPPSVVPRYAEQVMNIMNAIGEEEVTVGKDA